MMEASSKPPLLTTLLGWLPGSKTAKADVTFVPTYGYPVTTTTATAHGSPATPAKGAPAHAKEDSDTKSPAPRVAVPYAQLGALNKEVLYGARGRGVFVCDHGVSFTTRTANGVALGGTATRSGTGFASKVTGSVAVPWAARKRADGTTIPAPLVGAALRGDGGADLDLSGVVTPGLRATLATTLSPSPPAPAPAPAAPAGEGGAPPKPAPTRPPSLASSLAWEYYGCNAVHVKGSTTLDPHPSLTLAVGSGRGGLVWGGDCSFSTARATAAAQDAASAAASIKAKMGTPPQEGEKQGEQGQGGQLAPPSRAMARTTAALLGGVTKWSAGVSWLNQEHEVSAHFTEASAAAQSGGTPAVGVRLGYAWRVDPDTTLGAEVTHDVPLTSNFKAGGASPPPKVTLGYSARVPPLGLTDEGGDRAKRGGPTPDGTWALAKFKADSMGNVSALYTDRLRLWGAGNGGVAAGEPALLVTWCACINALTPLARAPKVALMLELV